MRSASAPSSGSQSSRWYFAFASPHRSGQMSTAWSPAVTPSFVWPSTMRAFGDAIEMSARRPTASPAPTAGPVIAETIGVGQATHVVDEVARLVEDAPSRCRVVGDLEHEVEVAARAERAVGAADEHDARLVVLADRAPDRARARRASHPRRRSAARARAASGGARAVRAGRARGSGSRRSDPPEASLDSAGGRSRRHALRRGPHDHAQPP